MPDARRSPKKPRDDEIDVFGLTHAGKVRTENQDHFLVCQLLKKIEVHLTSLPEEEVMEAVGERLAFLAMVADGVGGGKDGEVASRMVVSTVTRYVSESIDTYYTSDSTGDDSFTGELNAAALRVHSDLLEAGESGPGGRRMSTTLTLLIFVWPHVYALQVGDSRYYQLRGDDLLQVTRDQTVGQQLVDSGVLPDKAAASSKWAGVLSSSIGGSESEPVVTRVDSDWGYVHLICSDGLTKHVSDERIRERLASMTSARQVCDDLLQDALDGGGSDNISLIVVRPLRKDD